MQDLMKGKRGLIIGMVGALIAGSFATAPPRGVFMV